MHSCHCGNLITDSANVGLNAESIPFSNEQDHCTKKKPLVTQAWPLRMPITVAYVLQSVLSIANDSCLSDSNAAVGSVVLLK